MSEIPGGTLGHHQRPAPVSYRVIPQAVLKATAEGAPAEDLETADKRETG
ncbi:hypothetical protein [uncultured Cohaesibacter sp.]|nr:hypothetical protein [uncultured Cohaesibacter sp.]